MKREQIAAAPPITFCGEFEILISGDFENGRIFRSRNVVIVARQRQTDVSVENFTQFEN